MLEKDQWSKKLSHLMILAKQRLNNNSFQSGLRLRTSS